MSSRGGGHAAEAAAVFRRLSPAGGPVRSLRARGAAAVQQPERATGAGVLGTLLLSVVSGGRGLPMTQPVYDTRRVSPQKNRGKFAAVLSAKSFLSRIPCQEGGFDLGFVRAPRWRSTPRRHRSRRPARIHADRSLQPSRSWRAGWIRIRSRSRCPLGLITVARRFSKLTLGTSISSVPGVLSGSVLGRQLLAPAAAKPAGRFPGCPPAPASTHGSRCRLRAGQIVADRRYRRDAPPGSDPSARASRLPRRWVGGPDACQAR